MFFIWTFLSWRVFSVKSEQVCILSCPHVYSYNLLPWTDPVCTSALMSILILYSSAMYSILLCILFCCVLYPDALYFILFCYVIYYKILLFLSRPMGTKVSTVNVDHDDIPVVTICPQPFALNIREHHSSIFYISYIQFLVMNVLIT